MEDDLQLPAPKRLKPSPTEDITSSSDVSSGSHDISVPQGAPLFYLTTVRGIADQYNNSSMAIGIKGLSISIWYVCQLFCIVGTCDYLRNAK